MLCGNVVGVGNTATIYEWEESKVLKLFNQGYHKEAVEKEFYNAMEIRNMNFSKPNAYEIISYEERIGIIYDKVKGESLSDWVMRSGDIQRCAEYMAKLHKEISQNKNSNVQNYKEFLKFHILNAKSISLHKREEALKMVDKLPEGDTLCHGDFHPGNILISDGNATVIDFMNICHGDFLYDVARTVYLVEYTPVPMEVDNREVIIRFKKTLADLYLIQMNVTREKIQDYLSVIMTARKGECPDE